MQGNSWGTIVRLTESGSPDTTFSGDGFAPLTEGATPDKLVRLADGRVLFADGSRAGRLTAAGAQDPSFGGDGVVRLFSGPVTSERALALSGEGRVVVGGEPGLGFRAAAVDPAGGVSGAQLIAAPMLEGATIVPRVVLATGDGTTIAGVGGDDGVALARLKADGTPDWSTYDPDVGRLLSAASAPDGGVAVTTFNVLLRYTPTGERDTRFGVRGMVDVDFTPTGVAVLNDGRVLVSGYDFNGLRAERYTAEGALDPSFSGDGRFTLPPPGGGFFAVNDLLLQADGKAVIVGADNRDMVLVRLTPSGALDPAFSGDGIANGLRWSAGELLWTGWSAAEFPGGGLFVDGPNHAVRLSDAGELDWSFVSDVFGAANSRPDEDGRVVVAQPIPNTDRTRFARLDPDGALDPLFGTRELALGEAVVTEPVADGATLVASAAEDSSSSVACSAAARSRRPERC